MRLPLLLVAMLLCARTVFAEPLLVDEINGHDLSANHAGSFIENSIAWVYTPDVDMDVISIATFANDWGESRGGSRPVLLEVWTDLPREGGQLLAAGLLNYVSWTWSAATFPVPVHFEAGTSYLIGLDNMHMAGTNYAMDGDLELLPYYRAYKNPQPGTQWYNTDTPGQVAAPRFQFFAVPEPSTLLLLSMAGGAYVVVLRARRARSA